MKYDKSINSWIALPNELVKHPVYNYSFDELYNGIQEEVLKGNIIEKEYGNLRKYHYHQTNMFTNGWNEFSTLCRGLILDIKNKSIVATPYPKFFNLFEIDKLSMIKYIGNSNRIVCKEKYDGSLGVIYYYDNKWKIDTKGAFNTEQAEHAQCWVDYYFNDESDHKINLPSNVKTILVEIIYPQNRIVVNYKHFDGIVFLSYYDINGYEHLEFPVNGVNNSSLEHLLIPDIKIISKLDILKLEETLNNDNENGEVMEGYVITLSNGIKFKLKSKDYVNKHKVYTSFSKKSIFEIWVMKMTKVEYSDTLYTGGKIIKEILKLYPEEYHADILDYCFEFNMLLINFIQDIFNHYIEIPEYVTIPEFGFVVKNNPPKDDYDKFITSSFFILKKQNRKITMDIVYETFKTTVFNRLRKVI